MNRSNPVPDYWAVDGICTPTAMVMHDLFESGDHEAALRGLVGQPACILIGSDCYEAVVTRATPKTLTAAYVEHDADGLSSTRGARVFRLTKRGWTRGSFYLAVGRGETRLSREF